MLVQSVKIERDLRLEAATISEMAENIANDTGFRVPKVDWTRAPPDAFSPPSGSRASP